MPGGAAALRHTTFHRRPLLPRLTQSCLGTALFRDGPSQQGHFVYFLPQGSLWAGRATCCFTMSSFLHPLYLASYALNSSSSILQLPCVLYPASCSIYPASCLLYPASSIFHPICPVPCILHHGSCIRHPPCCILHILHSPPRVP